MSNLPRPNPHVKPLAPPRSVEFIDLGWPDMAHVVIRVGHCRTDYILEQFDVPPEVDGEGFRLIKCCPVPDGEEQSYNVLLTHRGHDCDCKGFAAHGRCKHVDSLLDLRREGTI